MKKTDKKITAFALILFVISAVLVYFVNHYIPFMMDDEWYSTLLYSDEKIDSLSDVINAQIWHWHNWGGRSITHGLLQLILMCGESFADVLNTVFLFILSLSAVLVSGVSSGCRIKNPAYIFVTYGLILGLCANWKMSMFWQAGAANYLYITVFILLFIFCYLREAGGITSHKDITPLKGITFWIIPLGIISGWSNENMGPVCFILSVITMILLKKDGKKIRAWMLEGSVLSLFGSIMCIAAPGNFVRSAENYQDIGILWKTFLRFYYESTAVFKHQILTVTVLSFILIMSIWGLGIALTLSEKMLLAASFLSWGAMILSPHYPDRATFGTMCLMICVIISRSALMIRQKKEVALPLFLGSLIIWLKGLYDLCDFLANVFYWIR